MLIVSYVIKHVIINKNKILHKLFYTLFLLQIIRIYIRIAPESYMYHLRGYMINLRFIVYKTLEAQC
jgi:hypothetical protein